MSKKNVKLYTFFFEYKKGTYIHQSKGQNVKEALRVWTKDLPIEKIENTDVLFKEILLSEVDDVLENSGITPIKNVTNVWCCSFLFADAAVGILTIVSTQE